MNHQRPRIDLSSCELEPIHIPGSIQPHGILIALAEPDLRIIQVSENLAASFGRPADVVIGLPLRELIDRDSTDAVAAALARPRPTDANPIPMERFHGIVHRHQGVAILELEPAPDAARDLNAQLRLAIGDLQAADAVESLVDTAVGVVKRLTGFERVMVYRFDEDEHGSVVAESLDAGLDPYLGLHYPASDIPRQARELYRTSWLRIIPDARYTPSRLVPPVRPDTGAPLDLSFSLLRSVSPIHLRYLANMGVRASMSISLIVRGRLWGLVSCLHHSAPRFIGHEVRSACEAIGRLVSLQLAALDDRERAELRQGRRATLDVLAEAMTGDEPLEGLAERPDELLSLVGATGAAIVGGGPIRTVGRVPPPEWLEELARWLADRTWFATSSLAAEYTPAMKMRDLASGLLAVALPGQPPRRVLWFRPEAIETVVWGGDPRKPAEVDEGRGFLNPRRSFAKWKEEVHLQAPRWSPSDLEAAEELRRRAVEIDLGCQLGRARRAVRLRDDLVAVVSHDLRNPLNVIQMQAVALLRSAGSGDNLRASADRIQRAVDRMLSLITDLLDLAKIEAGQFDMQLRPREIRDLIDEALALVRPLAEAKRVAIVDQLADSCIASVDRDRMHQVISNIVGNAIKFTPEDGTITVQTRCAAGDIQVSVADTGPGIPEDEMAHVFDRYWKAARAVRAPGSGLGLYIAKGIVEAHGGRIWVERAPGGGARFTFAIPR